MTVQTLSSRCFLSTFNAMKASNKFVCSCLRQKCKKVDIIASTGGTVKTVDHVIILLYQLCCYDYYVQFFVGKIMLSTPRINVINLLMGIFNNTVRRQGIEMLNVCAVLSNTHFIKETKWSEIAVFYVQFFPKNVF